MRTFNEIFSDKMKEFSQRLGKARDKIVDEEKEKLKSKKDKEKQELLSNIRFVEIKIRHYRLALPLIKKYFLPFVKVLKKYFGAKYEKNFKKDKVKGILEASWKVEFGSYHFEVKMSDNENTLTVSREKYGTSPYEKLTEKIGIEDRQLADFIRENFIDYLFGKEYPKLYFKV